MQIDIAAFLRVQNLASSPTPPVGSGRGKIERSGRKELYEPLLTVRHCVGCRVISRDL